MKLADCVDILVHIIYVQFKIDKEKDNRYTECMKSYYFSFLKVISAACISLFIIVQHPNCYHLLSWILAIIFYFSSPVGTRYVLIILSE